MKNTASRIRPSIVRTLLKISVFLGARVTTYSHARMAPRLTEMLRLPKTCSRFAEYIRRGHSHNDYHQANPLSSALRHGLNSIEVDVYPRKEQLWVAHTIFELDEARTIEKLYVTPILTMLQRSGMATTDPRVTTLGDARPFPRPSNRQSSRRKPDKGVKSLVDHQDDSLTLMVDFKGDAEKSVTLLHSALSPLRPYLSHVDKYGTLHKGKVTILVSGNRPRDSSLVSQHGERFLFIDGRAHDIRLRSDTNLVPMVSLPWRNLQMARMLGRGQTYMRRMSERAHQQGKRLRIWGAPNSEHLWAQMVRNNVDLLSIDDHDKFVRFASRVGLRSA